jgi:predicted RNase H-like HicB family nuclease
MKLYLRRLLHRIKTKSLVPGTIIKCESGRYLAYYEHRQDIIANGDTESEARQNLKMMYETVRQYECGQRETIHTELPVTYKAKKFTEMLKCF